MQKKKKKHGRYIDAEIKADQLDFGNETGS